MRKTDKTKKEFEKALLRLLLKKNYHDISINEICSLAGKTKMTFYHYYKDKADLLASASINLINEEYSEAYRKILRKETDPEEIEYQSILVTYDWVAKHYNQIQNLTYEGDTFPMEIFKNALSNNYDKYITELIKAVGYDVPSNYVSIFFFEGLYGSCLYYAEQLKNNKDKKKVKEDIKKLCRFWAKLIMSATKES
ncbi:MAG: TetR/AcrR family transcriptional regulator [Bacilli bacterium]|nr:TetR/AcrR family transcriptional regulator [Bacilli bacterium]